MSLMAVYQEGSDELTVTFRPSLFLQRRGWVFDILRREGITEVLDVGCGEGSLISCMCNPAPWLLPPPPSIIEAFATSCSRSLTGSDSTTHAKDEDTLMDVHSQPYPEYAPDVFLHASKVIGLDISPIDLEYAVQATAPNDMGTRWEPLEAQIWQGGLEVFNPAFVGTECIVATEVIEHLTDDVLQHFAPVLLGAYHPRFLLITTPSYTFNQRFTAPDAPRSARSGYPDPTKRTDRVFRHRDHKFEWTPEEFTDWCTAVAETWGYDVEVDGVGRAAEKDDWGRDEAAGYASQVAAFVRRDDEGWEERRRMRYERTQQLKGCAEGQHKLLVTHKHLAHEKAGQPLPLGERGETIKRAMIDLRSNPVRLGELWWEESVAVACGGWMELMVDAIAHHPDLRLEACKELPVSDWTAELVDGLPEDTLSPEPDKTTDSPWLSSGSDGDEELATPPEDDAQLLGVVPECYEKLITEWPPVSGWSNLEGENAEWGIGGDGWGGTWTDQSDTEAA